MGFRIFQVDSFTGEPFKGNPAAVCLLDEPAPEAWLQKVAFEMRASETAFLLREEGHFRLRWFTPKVEVDLCGHATLASAHILWEEGILESGETARFMTNSGLLTATKTADHIEMDFPLKPAKPVKPPRGLAGALGASPLYVGQSDYDLIVLLDSEDTIRNLVPSFKGLAKLPVRGVGVTARSNSSKFDFVSRFFAPVVGIDEDPVTGSAHCTLGPFWAEKLGKTQLVGYQASARSGVVRVQLKDDRVLLGGQAVTVFKAQLTC